MSGENEAKQVTVKIIETVYVEADTADEFKSVVQRLTGKDAVADETEHNGVQRIIGTRREANQHGDHNKQLVVNQPGRRLIIMHDRDV
uniref:VQ domain-containing protein n=1 Tax=Leersia perrieri TaxID=77586 RepID=A0A0D9WK02_9ORYZ